MMNEEVNEKTGILDPFPFLSHLPTSWSLSPKQYTRPREGERKGERNGKDSERTNQETGELVRSEVSTCPKGMEKTCQSDQREREVSERSFFSLISHTLTAHTPSLLTVPAVSSARHHFLAHDRLRDSEAKGALARRGKRRERADRSPLSYLPRPERNDRSPLSYLPRPERNGMGGRGPNSFSLPCLLTAIPHSTLHLHAIASGSEGLARDGKSEGDGCVVSPYPSL